MLDAASEGALWAKSYNEAIELIELMAANEYQNPSQRLTLGKVAGILELDAATAIAAQLKALTMKVDTWPIMELIKSLVSVSCVLVPMRLISVLFLVNQLSS